MNGFGIGIMLLALLLAGGAILGLIAVADDQQQLQVVDSMGNVPDQDINQSRDAVTNATAPLAGFGGGVILVAACLVVFAAVIVVWRASQGPYRGRR